MSKNLGKEIRNAHDTIKELVSTTRERGEADHYHGKRGWIRYETGMRLDATTDPEDATAGWPVTMHNMSGGGCAFWSKRELITGSVVFLREFGNGPDTGWLSAHVQHCTKGIRGFLIGVALKDALPQNGTPDVSSSAPAQTPAHESGHAQPEQSTSTPTAEGRNPSDSRDAAEGGSPPGPAQFPIGLRRRLRHACDEDQRGADSSGP